MKKINNNFNEQRLVERVSNFLIKQGYKIRSEVPTMGQRADLMAVKDQLLTVIEAKIKDKKRVLIQCKSHKIIADFICIAWGGRNMPQSLITDAKRLGYGVIHCNPESKECLWTIKPIRNEDFWAPQKNILIKKLENIPYD